MPRRTLNHGKSAGKEKEKQDILTDKKDTDTQVQEIAEAAAMAKADLEAIQNKIGL